MKLYFPLFVVLFFFSCKDGKEAEIVDFNDVSPDSERNYDLDSTKISNVQKSYFDSLTIFSRQLIDSLEIEHISIKKIDTLIFPDRFGAKKTEKWAMVNERDSMVFFHWEFSDSLKAQNTFYNWLDCYGNKCKSIRIGDEARFSSRATSFLLYENHLFFLEGKETIDLEKFLVFFDNLKWGEKWTFLVNQAPRKKANWFERDAENKLIKSIKKVKS
jgi:hypothetical protein